MTSRFKLAAVLLVLGALAACGPSTGVGGAAGDASAATVAANQAMAQQLRLDEMQQHDSNKLISLSPLLHMLFKPFKQQTYHLACNAHAGAYCCAPKASTATMMCCQCSWIPLRRPGCQII